MDRELNAMDGCGMAYAFAILSVANHRGTEWNPVGTSAVDFHKY
jgi:hypothetical protein